MKIKFKDLDNWLKIAVIVAWGEALLYIIYFLIGFFSAI